MLNYHNFNFSKFSIKATTNLIMYLKKLGVDL